MMAGGIGWKAKDFGGREWKTEGQVEIEKVTVEFLEGEELKASFWLRKA